MTAALLRTFGEFRGEELFCGRYSRQLSVVSSCNEGIVKVNVGVGQCIFLGFGDISRRFMEVPLHRQLEWLCESFETVRHRSSRIKNAGHAGFARLKQVGRHNNCLNR